MVGLGCIASDDPVATERAVATALESGYRLIDTASVYENEHSIGRALRSASITRDDLFVTTKVWNSDLGYDRTLSAFERSIDKLQVEYLDLYMIHWPLIRLRTDAWRALKRLLDDGRCRSIGVCNFAIRHLEEIVSATGVVPAVNQFEVNPFLNQNRLREWCRRKDVLVQTNTPLSRLKRRHRALLHAMAERYGKTPEQVLIRWALQMDIAVLIRSVDIEQIRTQAHVFDFELSLPDMDTLNSLNENMRIGWDPTNAP